MSNKKKVGIIGAAGYTGGELIRLLINHPNVDLTLAYSETHNGKFVSKIHTDLLGETDLQFSNEIDKTYDLLFLCLPHTESKNWLQNNSLSLETNIIDLGNDFRVENIFQRKKFVYGLPESNKSEILSSQYIANPGCFATAIQLALLPLAKEKLLNKVHVTGITGSTGAGKSFQKTSHFSWRSNNISAYKTLQHQHVSEICHHLERYNSGKVFLDFIPWRGDFTRGIYTSSSFESYLSLDSILAIFKNFYLNHPFVYVSDDMIDLKQVINTNKCFIHIEQQGKQVVIHSILDNLLKGASGQAIQNMNLMYGWEEKLGLNLKAIAF